MTKQHAHLENWIWIEGWQCFGGIVTGHPKIADGQEIFTSKVVKQSVRDKIIETKNTFYTLGEPLQTAAADA